MAICNHLAPNGEKSILYAALEQDLGGTMAHDLWTASKTLQFQNKFPEYPKDENGEPTVGWLKNAMLPKQAFKPKNIEQEQAIEGIQNHIENGNPKDFFTVAGKAGTGKTTLVQEAIAPFVAQGQEVLVTALSHKAKLVLANKLEERFGENKIKSASIAGALGMGMDMETGKFAPEFSQSETPPPITTADIVIVDEASMVNEEALQLIMGYKQPHAKVIFLGDIGQLPPIREKGDPNTGKPSPVFSDGKQQVSLVERVRQGEESPILPYADKFWDNSQAKTPVANPAQDLHHDIVSEKGALVFSKTMTEIMDQILPVYKEAIETNNPDKIKTVVYRNDTRNTINTAIRKFVFGEDAKNQINKGELMMFQDNYTVNRETISNATEVQVTSVNKGKDDKYGYDIHEVTIRDAEGNGYSVKILDEADKQNHANDVSSLFAEAKTMPKGKMRNDKLKEAWGLKRRFAPLEYSYAITSHKSQGSTYDHVIVHERDIMSVQPITAKEKSQSIYTALTRARFSTTVIDGITPGNKDNVKAALSLAEQKSAAPDVLPTVPIVEPPPVKVEGPKTGEPPAPKPVDSPKQPEPVKQDYVSTKMVSFEPGDKEPIKGVTTRESEEQLVKRIHGMYEEAKLNPNVKYQINYDFKTDRFRYKSGYTAKELANIFDAAGDRPTNVYFTDSFERLLANTSRRILDSLDIKPPELINRNEEAIIHQAGEILIPKRDSQGALIGYFTAAEQQDIIDSALYATHAFLLKDPNFGANAIVKTFKGFEAYAKRDPNSNWGYVFDQRVKVATEMLKQMEMLGYKIDSYSRKRILLAVEQLKDLNGIEAPASLKEGSLEAEDHEMELTNGEFIQTMARGLRDWGEVSFEHDPKDTASSRMKMFIAMQPEMDKGVYRADEKGLAIEKPAANLDKWAAENPKELRALAYKVNRREFWMEDKATTDKMIELLNKNHSVLSKKNFLGLDKLVDFEDTFQDILSTLADSPKHDYDQYMAEMRNTGRPNLIALADRLDKADQQVKNEFAKLVSMQYTNFSMLLFNRSEDVNGTSWVLRPILSNRYSQRNNILKNWRENQKISEIMKVNDLGKRVIDTERAKNNWIPALKRFQKLNWGSDGDAAEQQKAKNFIQGMFRVSGIVLSNDMINTLFKRMEKITKGTSVSGGIAKQFSITNDGKPGGMFSAFIMKMAGLSNVTDINSRIDSQADIERRAEMNNPLYTENTTMQILTRVAAEHLPVLHSGSSRNSEGKDIWDYSMHNKLSHLMLDIKDDFWSFNDRYKGVDIAKNNHLLNKIMDMPQYTEKMKLMYMDGMKSTWGRRGTTRGDMSDREQVLMSLALFQNQGDVFNTVPQANYFSLTHSDKTTTPLFMNMPRYDFGVDDIPKESKNLFYNVFKAEHERIIRQEKLDFNDARYNKGKSLFYFMPEFNREAMAKMMKDGTITDREFKTIWMNGENLTRDIRPKIERAVVDKILDKIIEDRISSTVNAWTKHGITNEQGLLFDKQYLRKLSDKIGITREQTYDERVSGRPGSIIKRDGTDLSKQEADQITVRTAAKDYALNYFIHNVGISQLFFGDPALTFKAGKTDMESVDLTLKEYGKRLAKDIAPGLDPYFRPQDKKFLSMTLADHNQAEKYLDNLRKIFPSYGKVNATDAQELTTTQEHITVKYAHGEISSKMFNDMMNIINNAKDGYYEFTNPDHLRVILQPHKPVFAAQRPASQGAILEDYVKSSSIPLYPPATSGLELDGLRHVMEDRGIARAPFESAKKIGAPSNPVKFFTADGRFKMPGEEEINKSIVQLDRSGFRIQQEVPYDEEKEAIKTVSQMNKLIVEGIEDLNNFKIGSREYSGQEIRNKKESIRKAMIGLNYENFLRSWGIENGRIGNLGRVYDRLVATANDDNFTTNEIQGLLARDDNSNLFIPLMYNTGADKYESMLMKMVKDIAQVKMPGKSFVQASPAGWTFKKEGSMDKSKIVWMDGYDGSPLKTTRVEEGVVKPAQVIIPFNFMDRNGIPRNVEEYMIERDGKRMLDTAKVPKELTQLIGARIPNQGHSSMAAMEVVGFLPKNMGDVIIVPAGFTKQMGADFDVDKLYTYRRPYYHNYEANTFHPDHTPDTMQAHQADYFDVHWSVLTHPEMAERILKPLDKPDLKEENELLKVPVGEGANYFDVQSQLQDFQNGKDAKMLVGLTSLSVTFNSVIQDKNLYYVKEQVIQLPDGRFKRTLVRSYVQLKDEHTGETLHLSNLSGNGKSTYTKQDGGTVDDTSTRTKTDNHTSVQSAAVDNAKDRSLDNLNITPHTYNALDALNQLETEGGKALNLKYGTRLLTQPIIKEFSQEMKKGNDSLSTEFSKDLKQNIIEKLRAKYRGDFDEADIEEKARQVLFDPQLLLEAQQMEPGTEKYAIHQLAAMNLFEEADAIGERLSELRSYFNQDTQGAGKNILTAMDKSDKLTKLDQAPINGASAIFRRNGELTEAGMTAAATTGVAVNVLTQILPYDKYANIFYSITSISGRDALTLDQQRDVLRAARSFTYNSGQFWWDDASAERGRLFYTRDGDLSLARRIEEAKRTWGEDNYFLQRLDPVIGDSRHSPDFIEYQAATSGRIDEANNTRAWTELLMSKDQEKRQLGEDLLRYAYLTGGVQDSNSFVKFIPNAYISNTDFGNMLKQKAEYLMQPGTEENPVTADMPGFIQQFIQHNPHMAYQIDREVFTDISADQNYPESFRYDPEEPLHEHLRNEEDSLREFLAYRSPTENKWILYHTNYAENGVFYTRIDTLGNQYTDEYNGEVPSAIRSIFTDNRSLANHLPAMSAESTIPKQPNYENHYTHYESIGVRPGEGAQHLNEQLENIATNPKLNESLRSVAKVLLDSNPEVEKASLEAKKLLNVNYKGPVIKFDDKMPELATTHPDGTLTFNPNTTHDINQAAEAVLHETIHHKLQSAIQLSGYDRKLNELLNDPTKRESTKAFLKQLYADFRKNHPELVKTVETLDKLRYQAYHNLIREMGPEAVARGMEKINGSGILDHNEQLLYAFHDVQEFVTHVMTNKVTQEYLNNVKADPSTGTFLNKVWKVFTDMLEAMGRTIGKYITKDSLLHQAVYHTLTLTHSDIARNANLGRAMLQGERMDIPTENEARDTKDMIERTYDTKVDINKDHLGWHLNAKLQDKPRVSTPIGKLQERLKKQLSQAYRDIGKGTQEERVQARIRYNELREDYNNLMRERSESAIARIANKQLEWVDKVIKEKNANPANVQAAIDTANLWGSVQEIMYSEQKNPTTIDPTIATLQSQAIGQRIKLINSNAVKVVTDAFGTRMTLKPEDLSTELKEVPGAEAKFLTLSRVKPKLMSGIGMLTKYGADNRDEHMNRVHKQLLDLRERMRKLGVTADHFMQKGTWGLIDRLSNQWHEHMATLNEERNKRLEDIAKTEGLPKNVANERSQKAWSDYWNQVRKVGTFVDSRIFFDVHTGSKRTGADVDRAYESLVKSVGSKDHADSLIAQAHDKYQRYIQERSIQAEYLDSQIHLSEEDKAGKTPEEQEQLRKSYVQDELGKWLNWNSPHEFLNKMIGKGTTKYLNNGDRWVVMAPKADQKGFYDPRYDEMMGNKEMRPVFEEYKGLIQEMASYLPPEYSENLPPGFLPIVSNETVNSLASMIGKLKNFDNTLMQMLTATEGEEWARLRPDEIPIMYTRETKWTADEANRSKDLIRVAEVFSMMALHYKYMAPILDQVNVTESIIKEANRQRTAGESDGPVLRNALDSIQYNKDKLIYNKPNPLEGKIDSKVYSITNPAKQARFLKEIKKLNEDRAALKKKIDENLDNGQYDNKEEEDKIEKIDQRLTELEDQARYIYASKAVDTVISINQLKALGYNPFSAISNFTFGLVSAHIHSTGKLDYEGTHWRQALGIMTHAMKNYFTFGAAMDKTANKIRAIMERAQVMTHVGDSGYIAKYDKSSVKRALSPYNWQESGDYYTKGSMMIAMMLKKQIEVTDVQTGEKKMVSLWDSLDQEGKLDTTKYMDDAKWYHEDVNQQTEWNQFRERMRGVATMVFGNQDKNSPLLAKKSMLWRLAGQFRMSWFPEGLNSRFGSERFDPLLQRDVKGRYRSFGTLGIYTSSMIMMRSLLDMLPGIHVDRFGGLTDKEGNAIKDIDKENMRRNFAGIAWTVSVTAAMMMLRAFDTGHKGKKRDDDDRKRQLIVNMLIRNQQDLMMYASPSVWDTVTGNLVPATAVITDTYKAMKATGHYLFGDTHKDKHAFRTWMLSITRATPILNNINKANYMFNRDLDAIKR
jgi:hypothetical protein